MATTTHLDIVSAEREIFSGPVEVVFAPAPVSYTHLTLPPIYSV